MFNESWETFKEVAPECYYPHQCVDYAGSALPQNRLYISAPRNTAEPAPVIVFFHGGGMTGDWREVPRHFFDGGRFLIVECRYRVFPAATPEEALNDCAGAIAWVFDNISQFGGDPKNIFISGQSAGSWLAATAVMNPVRMAAAGISSRSLAGLMLFSGQMTTHYQLKIELNYRGHNQVPVIDEYAPIHYAAAELPPILLITGSPELDMPSRPEENAYMAAVLRACGHRDVTHYMLAGSDHGGCMLSGQFAAMQWAEAHIRK